MTLQDVKEILEVVMPKRKISQEDLIELIEAKHKAQVFCQEFTSSKGIDSDSGSLMVIVLYDNGKLIQRHEIAYWPNLIPQDRSISMEKPFVADAWPNNSRRLCPGNIAMR